MDVLRAQHRRLAAARQNLGAVLRLRHEAPEDRRRGMGAAAATDFADLLAPHIGNAPNERPLDRMDGDDNAAVVGQPTALLAGEPTMDVRP
jgi:hypothetical protein